MAFHILALTLAGILCIADYITENFFSEKLRKNKKLISFSSGAAIAYIILSLFPEIAASALIDGKMMFLYTLAGFVSLNLVEQYVTKRIGKLKNLPFYHKNIHIAYFFTYNFLVGIVLVNFASKGMVQALLFFVPFLLYIIIKILPQDLKFKNAAAKIFYSSPTFFGAVFGIIYAGITDSIFGEIIAFITGTLLYSVIRESLPSDESEKPLYFMLGVLFYAFIIVISWNI